MLSTTKIQLFFLAILEISCISDTFIIGLVGVSIYIILVFLVITFSIFFILSVSTKVVVIPFLLSTFSINLIVPPYKSSVDTILSPGANISNRTVNAAIPVLNAIASTPSSKSFTILSTSSLVGFCNLE